MALLDRVRFYIPGSTEEQDHKKFALLGGLLTLYYISKYSVLSDIKELLEEIYIKELSIEDFKLIITNLDQFPMPNYSTTMEFPM